MKEINFRAKSLLSDEKWRCLTIAPYAENTIRIVSIYDEDEIVDMNTLCQYTGLVDKNGVKIYENDICVVESRKVDEEDGYFVVEWDDKEARFILAGDGLVFDFGMVDSWNCEVVGNVFDDKELMKTAK